MYGFSSKCRLFMKKHFKYLVAKQRRHLGGCGAVKVSFSNIYSKEKEKRKKRKKKEGNYINSVTDIYSLDFHVTIVRWHWNWKNFGPPRKNWNDPPESSQTYDISLVCVLIKLARPSFRELRYSHWPHANGFLSWMNYVMWRPQMTLQMMPQQGIRKCPITLRAYTRPLFSRLIWLTILFFFSTHL